MVALALLLVALMAVAVGAALVSHVGLPTSIDRVRSWCVALLACAAAVAALPEIMRHVEDRLPPLPTIRLSELLPSLATVALAILGWWSLTRAASTPKEPTFRPRQRVAPPPPEDPEGDA